MPPKEDTTWWRGKHGFQVGFFPSECVELINDKIPQSVSNCVPKPVSKKHGKLITFLRSFMKSRPSKQKLKQRGILKERVFACDLGEHLLNSGQDVPQVLRSCAEFIEKHGIVDGIYRLSGIASNIQKLRHEFDSELIPELTKEVYLQDIHCVGSLCKLYFRELPNPLLTYQLYDKFSEAVSVATDDERLLKIHDVIQQLPPPHYRTLEFLMKHLSRLAAFSTITNMHAKNLAIVWAPNLLRSRQIESACFGGPAAFMEVRIQSVVVEFILSHADVLFSPKLTGHSSLARPKSLAVGGSCARLLSLEEAQARTQGLSQAVTPPNPHSRYIEVGEGPAALLGKFHTVIDFPTERKRQPMKTRKSPVGSWRSFFSLGKSSSHTHTHTSSSSSSSTLHKRKLRRNPSEPNELKSMALTGGRGDTTTLRSAKSEESLTSLHNVEGESKLYRPRRPRSSSDAVSPSFGADLLAAAQHCASYDTLCESGPAHTHTHQHTHARLHDDTDSGEDRPIFCVPALISAPPLPPVATDTELELTPPEAGMATLDFDPMSFGLGTPLSAHRGATHTHEHSEDLHSPDKTNSSSSCVLESSIAPAPPPSVATPPLSPSLPVSCRLMSLPFPVECPPFPVSDRVEAPPLPVSRVESVHNEALLLDLQGASPLHSLTSPTFTMDTDINQSPVASPSPGGPTPAPRRVAFLLDELDSPPRCCDSPSPLSPLRADELLSCLDWSSGPSLLSIAMTTSPSAPCFLTTAAPGPASPSKPAPSATPTTHAQQTDTSTVGTVPDISRGDCEAQPIKTPPPQTSATSANENAALISKAAKATPTIIHAPPPPSETTHAITTPTHTTATPSNTMATPINTTVTPTKSMVTPTNTMATPTKSMVTPTNTMATPTNTTLTPTNAMATPSDTTSFQATTTQHHAPPIYATPSKLKTTPISPVSASPPISPERQPAEVDLVPPPTSALNPAHAPAPAPAPAPTSIVAPTSVCVSAAPTPTSIVAPTLAPAPASIVAPTLTPALTSVVAPTSLAAPGVTALPSSTAPPCSTASSPSRECECVSAPGPQPQSPPAVQTLPTVSSKAWEHPVAPPKASEHPVAVLQPQPQTPQPQPSGRLPAPSQEKPWEAIKPVQPCMESAPYQRPAHQQAPAPPPPPVRSIESKLAAAALSRAESAAYFLEEEGPVLSHTLPRKSAYVYHTQGERERLLLDAAAEAFYGAPARSVPLGYQYRAGPDPLALGYASEVSRYATIGPRSYHQHSLKAHRPMRAEYLPLAGPSPAPHHHHRSHAYSSHTGPAHPSIRRVHSLHGPSVSGRAQTPLFSEPEVFYYPHQRTTPHHRCHNYPAPSPSPATPTAETADYHVTRLQPFFENGRVQYRYSPYADPAMPDGPPACYDPYGSLRLRHAHSFAGGRDRDREGGGKSGTYHYLLHQRQAGQPPPRVHHAPGGGTGLVKEHGFVSRDVPPGHPPHPHAAAAGGSCVSWEPPHNEEERGRVHSLRRESRARQRLRGPPLSQYDNMAAYAPPPEPPHSHEPLRSKSDPGKEARYNVTPETAMPRSHTAEPQAFLYMEPEHTHTHAHKHTHGTHTHPTRSYPSPHPPEASQQPPSELQEPRRRGGRSPEQERPPSKTAERSHSPHPNPRRHPQSHYDNLDDYRSLPRPPAQDPLSTRGGPAIFPGHAPLPATPLGAPGGQAYSTALGQGSFLNTQPPQAHRTQGAQLKAE
ncbi:hypothetical protein ACEWY4_009137 [Coilia grayii]|uniref:Rho-GAP domain-containing protein n=1 Tax=Coilia grayii TaxID=363190 RepID=A0ABD1K5K6_9TELE